MARARDLPTKSPPQGSRRTAEQALNDGDLGASRLLPKRTLRLPDRPRALPQREGDSGAGRRLEAAREMAVAGRWPGEHLGMIEDCTAVPRPISSGKCANLARLA
jgi:hypothetical protein